MKGYVVDLEKQTVENTAFRRVLYTSHHMQLVLMSLAPGEEIGEEMHTLDQFIRFDSGLGEVRIDGVVHQVQDGYAVVIPAGALHNVVNVGTEPLRLYSVYAPPEHKDGIVHQTKREASEEHFDGVVTES